MHRSYNLAKAVRLADKKEIEDMDKISIDRMRYLVDLKMEELSNTPIEDRICGYIDFKSRGKSKNSIR